MPLLWPCKYYTLPQKFYNLWMLKTFVESILWQGQVLVSVSKDVRRTAVITIILFITLKIKWGFGVFFLPIFYRNICIIKRVSRKRRLGKVSLWSVIDSYFCSFLHERFRALEASTFQVIENSLWISNFFRFNMKIQVLFVNHDCQRWMLD